VRVVDENGAQAGVLSIRDALALAESKELDLIEVAPNATPPVCRIMDYGKYKYALAKRERDQHRKQKGIETKLLRLRPNIHEHDLATKIKHAKDFLQDGNKVRLNLVFRSREMSHPEIARQVMAKITEEMADFAIIESHPRIEGRMMSMTLAPKAAAGPTGS
jgi:translation initiation factor IF-3